MIWGGHAKKYGLMGGGLENITLLTASTVVKTFCQNAYNSANEVVKNSKFQGGACTLNP